MQKKTLLFVSLAILVSIMAGCIPDFIPPIKLSTTASPLEDPAIAVDLRGNSHIVGVSNDRIVYHRIDKLGSIKRTEILVADLIVMQSKPDIAVTDDGTAWIVWIEELPAGKKACFTSIPKAGDFSKECQILDDDPDSLSSGFVQVTARANATYAVFDSIHEISGKIKALFFRRLDTDALGAIDIYVSDGGILYGMDIGIDSNGYLHVVYIDRATLVGEPRLRYRANVTMGGFATMGQVWDIWEGLGVDPNVTPKISFHNFTSSSENVIMAYEGGSGYYAYVATCITDGCGSQVSKFVPDTNVLDLTEIDILGYFEPNGYVVSFVGKETVDVYPQVYTWNSKVATITQITNSDTNKSDLSMVYGFEAVIGFIEYIIKTGPPPLELPFETATVMEYDLSHGLRSVFHTACPHTSNDRKLDMASAMVENIPVAGVWNICDETWFSTNAFLGYMPLILK